MPGFTGSCSRRTGALLALLLLCCGATAQSKPHSTAPSREPAASVPHQVVVNNRLVTVMRGTFLGYSAEARAAGAERRLRGILAKEGPGNITVQEVPEGRGFSVDGVFAFFLTPGDVDAAFGETFEGAVADTRQALELLVRERAELSDPKAFAIALGLSAIATLVFIVILRLMVISRRNLRKRISGALATHARGVKIGGVSAVELTQFWHGVRFLLTGLFWTLSILLTYAWLVFVLERFPLTRVWGENLLGLLINSAGDFLRAIVGSIPGLLTVAVIFVIARWITQISAAFFSRVEAGRVSFAWLDADTSGPTRRIITVLVWLFALAMAYPYLPGAQTEAFKGLTVIVGLMISIGASNLVGQAASGLILMYARSFRPGEFVLIGETEGSVTELGLFSTRVRTGLGEEVMLPNSLVLSQSSKNYSRASPGTGYLVDSGITIGYATPWRQVHAMLQEAAHLTHGILEEPAPQVYQTALSDFFVQYRIVCHVDSEVAPQRVDVLGELHANIQDVFNEHGVQIMSPHYESDPERAQVVPPAKWYAPPAIPPAEGDKSG